MDRVNQLIQKYLDDAAIDAEVAELEALLRSDPAVADAFAAATRAAAFLASRLGEPDGPMILPWPPAPAPRRRFPWRFTVAAAIVLVAVCLGAFFLWPARHPESDYRLVSGRVRVGEKAGPLLPGAVVEVLGDELAVLRLPGNVRAEMAPASRFVLHGPGGANALAVELLSGSGTFRAPTGQGGFRVDTPVGSVLGTGVRFTVAVLPLEAGSAKLPEWRMTVAVVDGNVEVRQGASARILGTGDEAEFRKAVPPDLVGRIEAVAREQGSRNVNGKQEAFEETRLRILVRSGTAAGSRRTVRLAQRAASASTDRPAVGMEVRVWLDPREDDVAIHLERAGD